MFSGGQIRVEIAGSDDGLFASESYVYQDRPNTRLMAFRQNWQITELRLWSMRTDHNRWGFAMDDFRFDFFMIRGDTDGDFDVDIDDLNNVRNHFGEGDIFGPPKLGDTFPFDGIVDIDDLNRV